MKIHEILGETTVTGASSIAGVSQNMNKGKMISRTMYNNDGTMKNGLDSDNLMGSKKPKTTKKRRT